MSDLHVEQLAREYWDFVQDVFATLPFGEGGMFVYGLNNHRRELHEKLCQALGLDEIETKPITDNLDRYDCFEAFLEALYKLKGSVK